MRVINNPIGFYSTVIWVDDNACQCSMPISGVSSVVGARMFLDKERKQNSVNLKK